MKPVGGAKIPWSTSCRILATTTGFSTQKRWASIFNSYMDRVKRIWYFSPMRAAKVQASLRIRAVSPEPSLLAHTSSESRGTFRQKARSLAPLNGWACAVKICHDGMLEDTNSLDGAHIILYFRFFVCTFCEFLALCVQNMRQKKLFHQCVLPLCWTDIAMTWCQ